MDKEGFYYPTVHRSSCIGCGRCDSVCPVRTNDLVRSDHMEVYGCQIQDKTVRRASTSGGVFTALAEEALRQGGCVFAAGFDERMHVLHKRAETSEQLREMRGSKYTQSEMGEVFSQIKALLAKDRPVFFVGTPCQVEGLLCYTGRDPSLITVDLACYGVPSPGLYDKYIAFLGEKYASPVKELYFRDKKYGYSGVNVKVVLRDGRILEDNLDVKSYGKSMFSQLGLRPICYDCPFRTRQKASDLTLGDFWEIGQYAPALDDETGVTKVSVHTEKGKQMLQAVSTQIRSVQVETLSGAALKQRQEQSALHRRCDWDRRRRFFEEMHCLDYPALMKKYLPASRKDRLNNRLKPVIFAVFPRPLSVWVVRMVKRRRGKGKENRKHEQGEG
ncbi:MAG: Coenzyme F420 hydrogenase/dehydrogenase, beta subunit C-terminal domain [Clostridiales bacterium]|nr:Coenzyme F420 hydrogenase/dehydrogenase, beta subunit C-terminal domain [Clostridiales bacterium]